MTWYFERDPTRKIYYREHASPKTSPIKQKHTASSRKEPKISSSPPPPPPLTPLNITEKSSAAFSHAEDVYLVSAKLHTSKSWAQIGESLGRTRDECSTRYRDLDKSGKKDEIVKEHGFLGTPGSVADKAAAKSGKDDETDGAAVKVNGDVEWTHERDLQLVRLKNLSGRKVSMAEVSAQMGVPEAACDERIRELGKAKKIKELTAEIKKTDGNVKGNTQGAGVDGGTAKSKKQGDGKDVRFADDVASLASACSACKAKKEGFREKRKRDAERKERQMNGECVMEPDEVFTVEIINALQQVLKDDRIGKAERLAMDYEQKTGLTIDPEKVARKLQLDKPSDKVDDSIMKPDSDFSARNLKTLIGIEYTDEEDTWLRLKSRLSDINGVVLAERVIQRKVEDGYGR